MDDYAGRVLADRYRLPLPPSDAFELVETRAFDTYSGQEVLVRQVPLPEVVDAEVVDMDGPAGTAVARQAHGRSTRRPADPAVRRAVEAAQAAAQIPDHPRLDQVFDVFAEDGSLWIVSERVAARPLAALLAEKPLNPYRAAEVASDVLTALRALHAHGWTHRNITVRTVLVCDDGRVVLTGLASGAAEEALCGYAPAPAPDADTDGFGEQGPGADPADDDPAYDADPAYGVDPAYDDGPEPDYRHDPGPQRDGDGYGGPVRPVLPGQTAPDSRGGVPDVRAARAGAIAAYRAGARAGARVTEDQRRGGAPGGAADGPVQNGLDPDWWARRPDEVRPERFRYEDGDEEGVVYGPVHDGDDDYDDFDGYDPGPGHARLAGTWHDSPFPGSEGPRAVSAGGGGPYGGALPALPGARYGDDPYGVRQASAESGRQPARDGYEAARRSVRDGGHGGQGGTEPPYGGGPRADRSSGPGGAPGPALERPGVTQPGGTPYGGARPALPGARAGEAPGPRGTAAGSRDRDGSGRDAPRADADRLPAAARTGAPSGRWDEIVAPGEATVYRGPATPLAAERARQARIAVVGAVTERWAPEQAGAVHENWQLAAPVGPATDLWALGALLFRAVQGHAPYPEESAAELVQLVCSEPPAFAEECGPLRPVVESLLRQDPTERPDFEELRGWLRSLVRSAPEPEAGMDVVPLPAGAVGGSRLPVVRRRGELVRRRRPAAPQVLHGRHRHQRSREPARRGPRSLGRTLLLLILLALVAAIAYAVLFMPKAGSQGNKSGAQPSPTSPGPGRTAQGSPQPAPSAPATATPGSQQPQTSAPAGDLPDGYVLRKDAEGFQVAVDRTWQRRPINDVGQVRYNGGDFTLIVVPGRDSVKEGGDDPLVYQRDKERELQPFRDSSWAGATGLRRIDVGQQSMAEGQFTWQDSNGRNVYVRNLALIVGDAYHVIQVIGPEEQRDKVTEIYEQATATYRATR
ncbi:protein kinase [Streptomyces sp. NPDC002187]|uniref:protein kinase n=1 Tax=Streptomyces sp. NPDC002187 TaxID=3364637 RepID=UPI00368EB16E